MHHPLLTVYTHKLTCPPAGLRLGTGGPGGAVVGREGRGSLARVVCVPVGLHLVTTGALVEMAEPISHDLECSIFRKNNKLVNSNLMPISFSMYFENYLTCSVYLIAICVNVHRRANAWLTMVAYTFDAT